MGLLESSMEVVKLAGKIANPDLVQAATKANIEALELSGKNLELQRKATDLERQVSDLEAKLKLSGEVFREGSLVFRDGDRDPCCSRCWDVDRELIHIVIMDIGGGKGYKPGCPQCKTAIHGFDHNPRMQAGA